MLRRLTIAGVLALMLGAIPMFGQASVPPHGCAAGGGSNIGNGTTMEEPGGFVIAGDGVVTVTRPGVEDPIVYTASSGTNGVSMVGEGLILVDDVVSCSATNGVAAAGNPEPSA